MYKQLTICCLTLFLSAFFSAFLLAQTIQGSIRTISGEPAAFAGLKLLRSSDSMIVAGTAAAANGSFSFQNVRPGEYFIQGSLIGYTDVYSPIITAPNDVEIKLESLTLSSTIQLGEATVNAKLPSIERQIDKVVVNVEGSTLAAGNNLLELLQRSPGVLVTPQGNVMLEGKSGVMVMVDGKPTQLSGDQLLAFLQSMPGESVSKIELIARPSSRYDAEGV
jgi:hypothetical protein